MEINQTENYGRHTDDHVSFRGNPIPEVIPKSNFQVVDSSQIMNKINDMSDSDRRSLTIDSVHFDRGLSDIKLSTGDIVSVETAIALAENNMLVGYSTGATVRGGRVLRSKPDPKNNNVKGIYSLPRF